jgi:F-type H+-transporting ATPase subunit delta
MSSNKSFSSETSDRYARALFELVQEKSELDVTEKNIKEFLMIYESSKEIENFIKNPTQSFTNQLAIIKKISELMKFTKNLENFFSILITKRRIFFLKKILFSFLKMVSLKRGELSAKLISSKKLTEDELKNISLELSKIIGSSITFNYKVDENLIGGFKMQLGSLMIDTSIKNKLKKYEQIMLEN